jgi:hypothetical protein
MVNSNPPATFTDAGSLDPLNATLPMTEPNAFNIITKRARAESLAIDAVSNAPSYTPLFTANDLLSGAVFVDDYMFVDNSYGIIKLSNGSFYPFNVQPNGVNRYYTRFTFSGLRFW